MAHYVVNFRWRGLSCHFSWQLSVIVTQTNSFGKRTTAMGTFGATAAGAGAGTQQAQSGEGRAGEHVGGRAGVHCQPPPDAGRNAVVRLFMQTFIQMVAVAALQAAHSGPAQIASHCSIQQSTSIPEIGFIDAHSATAQVERLAAEKRNLQKEKSDMQRQVMHSCV
jgi:hypothetical protein